ncbi:hypothetical protein [Candidatus Poriferisocius sp.]|uniref:hypothetical protein n=1 Tax=Candidatus Poriferisocius sp. TaxID=3101276 RepID=UPI003B016CB4
MLIYQSPVHANSVLEAISDCVNIETTAYRVAVAYATREGVRTLVAAIADQVGENWSAIPKTVITCFDFGHTEPVAIELLQENGFEVRIANLEADGKIRLRSNPSSFHPKLYLAYRPERVQAVVGSANLSRRALSVNVEAVSVVDLDLQEAEVIWTALEAGSVLLSDEMLNDYRESRPRQRAAARLDEPPIPRQGEPDDLPIFRRAVEDCVVNLNEHQALWVEAGGTSGGSGSQLELPRLAQRFFGFQFDNYDDEQRKIGEPILMANAESWPRPLTWHGHNRMERINLPTTAQSGLEYAHRIILFQRSGTAFEISVAAPKSARAARWIEESTASGTLFRVSANSTRRCGLI